MKVYVGEPGDYRLIGWADIPDDHEPVLNVPLFGASSIIMESFSICAVTHLPEGGGLRVERAVLLAPGQCPELLPGWQALSS